MEEKSTCSIPYLPDCMLLPYFFPAVAETQPARPPQTMAETEVVPMNFMYTTGVSTSMRT